MFWQLVFTICFSFIWFVPSSNDLSQQHPFYRKPKYSRDTKRADTRDQPNSSVTCTTASSSTQTQLCPPGPCTHMWKTPHFKCCFCFHCVHVSTPFFCEHPLGLRVALKCKWRKPPLRLPFQVSFWSMTEDKQKTEATVKLVSCGCCNTAFVLHRPQCKKISLGGQLERTIRKSFSIMNIRPRDQSSPHTGAMKWWHSSDYLNHGHIHIYYFPDQEFNTYSNPAPSSWFSLYFVLQATQLV